MAHRISVNQIVFGKETELGDDLEVLAASGLAAVGIHRDKLTAAGWEEGVEAVAASGLTVAYLIHRSMFDLEDESGWERQSAELIASVDASAQLGANAVYGTTGPPGTLSFEDAAEAFVGAIAPAAAHARERGVSLMIETTNPAFANIDFVHTLADSVEVAERAGIGVCIDLHACWTERDLKRSIERAVPLSTLVQISDYVPGTEDMNRAEPGEGIIPFERLLGWTEAAGFDGWYDLELRGLQGDMDAARRSVAAVASILDSVG